MIAFTDHGEAPDETSAAFAHDPIEVDKDDSPPHLWVLTVGDGKMVQVPNFRFAIQNFASSPDDSEFAVIRESAPSVVPSNNAALPTCTRSAVKSCDLRSKE